MILNEVLSAGPDRKRKWRIGRGRGSGSGCKAGRGQKGNGARTGNGGKLGHEGGQMPLFRRLPRRGFSNALFKTTYGVVNVGYLDAVFDAGDTVNLQVLLERRLIRKNTELLKVLGEGKLQKSLKVEAHAISQSARQKIEAASGSVVEVK